MSLRTKIVLSLLLTSLFSVALVGAVAYMRVMTRFDDLRLAGAARNFHRDVEAYVRTYGSWEAGERVLPFPEFTRRHVEADMRANGRPRQHGPGSDVAPPPGQGMPFHPPFQFLFFDAGGHALTRAGPYGLGDIVRPEDRAGSLPIMVDGQLIGFAVPRGKINYSDPELQFLSVARDALLVGCASAVILALGLGLLIGTRLSTPLRRLTMAIQAMEQGALRQRVVTREGGEIGVLAAAFNRMSEELDRNQAALLELSTTDGLTKLHNRGYFDAETPRMFDEAVRDGRPMSLMIADIDCFKRINDQFSHAIGDAVLRRIGEILRANIRATDQLARYGGEEFVVAFRDTPLPQAALLCERLRLMVEAAPWHEIHPELAVTMSIGLTGNLDHGSPERMLHAADELLYRAKSDGRNRLCFA